jgi:hypothetical protein
MYVPVAAMCQLYQPNQMINILVMLNQKHFDAEPPERLKKI